MSEPEKKKKKKRKKSTATEGGERKKKPRRQKSGVTMGSNRKVGAAKSAKKKGPEKLPPMPNNKELEQKFENLLQNLGIGEAQKKAMRMFPKEQKWTLICQAVTPAKGKDKSKKPEDFINLLKGDSISLKDFESLRISLGHENLVWLKKFIKQDGLTLFFDRFDQLLAMAAQLPDSEDILELITECVRCAKAVMNVNAGLRAVLSTEGTIESLANAIEFVSDKTKGQILELLAAVSLVSEDSHEIVHGGMKDKFPIVVSYLRGDEGEQYVAKVAGLTLVNALISKMSGDDRKKFREEWGFTPITTELRKQANEDLHKSLIVQLDIYDEILFVEAQAEENERLKQFENEMKAIQQDNIHENFKKLLDGVREDKEVKSLFEELLEELANVPQHGNEGFKYWNTIKEFVASTARSENKESEVEFTKNICDSLIDSKLENATHKERKLIEDSRIPKVKVTNLENEIKFLQKKIKELNDQEPKVVEKIVYKDSENSNGGSGEVVIQEKIVEVKNEEEIKEYRSKIEELNKQIEELQEREPEVVYKEKIVEKIKEVPRIIEKKVEVPVEKIVYQEKIVEKIVYRDNPNGGAPPNPEGGAPPTPGAPPAPGEGNTGAPPPPAPPAPGAPPAPPAPGAPPAPPAPGAPPAPPAPGGPPGPPPPPGAPPAPGGPPGPPPPPGGPPGPGGPPPLPGGPPLPGQMPNFLPKKKKIKPAVKLRGLMWDKIDNRKAKDTFWEKADESKFSIDAKELEDLFCAKQPPKPKPKEEEGGPKKAAKKKTITLLSGKRSNNVAIMLSRFGKKTNADIKKAIMDLDEKELSLDSVNALVKFAPEPDEITTLNEFNGDKNMLGKAEKFFMEVILQVPRFAPRLKSFATKLAFEGKIEGVKEALGYISGAVKEIKSSQLFPEFLELVLSVGNYLNGSTFRGEAYGFKLGSLNKMAEVKTANNKMTMMHYIAQLCENKHKKFLELPKEFENLHKAPRESMPQCQADINKLKGEINIVKNAIEHAPEEPGNKFKTVMEPFYTDASNDLLIAEDDFNKLEESYKKLIVFYGERPNVDSQAFFGNLSSFFKGFEKALADNERRKVMAEKQAAAEKRKKERLAAGGGRGRGGFGGRGRGGRGGGIDFGNIANARSGLKSAGERGLMDNLISGLRSGSAIPPASQNDVANEALLVFSRLKKTNRNLDK